jgi:hypothetical protein
MARSRVPTVLTGFPAVAKAVTPSDGTPLLDYEGNAKSMTIYVGTGGTVSVVPVGNDVAQPVSFVVPDGGLVPVECKYVRSTGTDATNMVGLF